MPRPDNPSHRPHTQADRRVAPGSSPSDDTFEDERESAGGPRLAVTNAREAAFVVLEMVREQASWVGRAWEQVLANAALNPADRSLSRELAFGVIRREITLDAILSKLVKRPLVDIEPALKSILHLGLYQILFADQIPPHAAVHETVELAKKAGRLRWGGFVNGILRATTRLCTDEFTDTAAANALPVGPAHLSLASADGEQSPAPIEVSPSPLRFRVLTEAIFPDPNQDFQNYFQQAYGYPYWLAARWGQRWSPEVLHRLGQWQRAPAPIFLRVNLLKTTRADLLARFQAAGLHTAPETLPEAVRVLSGGRIEQWPGYDEGLFSVQDLSAMHAARRLAPTPGSLVLDLCAAPGGKSCHLAELMLDKGGVVAVDIMPGRLDRIVVNAARLQLKAVQAVLSAADGHDLPRGPFDFILADVPCSNTGVISRRPEVPRNLTPASMTELSQLQRELLHRAADRVRIGGRLLYSTCSIEPEENEQVVQPFLAQRPEFRLIKSELLLPGSPADGGFQALLERTA